MIHPSHKVFGLSSLCERVVSSDGEGLEGQAIAGRIVGVSMGRAFRTGLDVGGTQLILAAVIRISSLAFVL